MYAEELEKKHKIIKTECVKNFTLNCMGTHRIKKDSERDLCEKINAEYQDIKKRNNIRRYVTVGIAGAAGAAGAVGVGALVYAAGGVVVSTLIGLLALAARSVR